MAGRRKQEVELLDSFQMQAWRYVAVGVHGHSNRAVSKQILYYLRVDSNLEQNTGRVCRRS